MSPAAAGTPRARGTRCAAALFAGALSALAAAGPAAGAEPAGDRARILNLEVTHQQGRYRLDAVADLAAPREAVFEVLADGERLSTLSGLIEESRVLGSAADGSVRVYTRLRGCVLFFCRTVERVERMVLEPPARIAATLIPEESDFDFGEALWSFEPAAGGSRVRLRAELEPSFWVPPVIGAHLIRSRLERDGREVLERVAERAREGGHKGRRDDGGDARGEQGRDEGRERER